MRPDGTVLFTLPLDRIFEDHHFNVRIFYGDIDELAVQLMTEGQREPIKVREDGGEFFVVDGHRRRRAFARSRDLRIESAGEGYQVWERDRPIREAPGPRRPDFSPDRVACRLVERGASEGELFASQLIYNSGKPFTLLERMIFVSRLGRFGEFSREQLALKTGFSRTHVANAQQLKAADPRLLEYVRDGRISQKLALRLLRVYSAEEQVAQVQAAALRAAEHQRDKILPKDFDWGGPPRSKRDEPERPVDPVRSRLHRLVARMSEATRFPPNAVAQSRLETLIRINRHTLGKASGSDVESFLLGRE